MPNILQVLCGAAWVNSKATGKGQIFKRSSGKIAATPCTTTPPRFFPQSKKELHRAVVACLALSPTGDCSKGAHGPIGKWDVSSVTDMSKMFYYARAFNADISKWDVSAVTDMRRMFFHANTFFNVDISIWDASAVMDMASMYYHASSFDQVLCGAAWVNSKARGKGQMFKRSSGKIAWKPCPNAVTMATSTATGTSTRFSPQSRTELQQPLSSCLTISPAGDCPNGVTDMHSMFSGARAFNADISKWDVSGVTGMTSMFYGSTSFKRVLCGVAWVNSKALGKEDMFEGSSGTIASAPCPIPVGTARFSPQSKTELQDALSAVPCRAHSTPAL